MENEVIAGMQIWLHLKYNLSSLGQLLKYNLFHQKFKNLTDFVQVYVHLTHLNFSIIMKYFAI